MMHKFKSAISLLMLGTLLTLSNNNSFGQEALETADYVIQRYIKALGGKKVLEKERSLKISFLTTSTAKKAAPKTKSNLFVSGSKSVYEDRSDNRTWYLDTKKHPWNKFGPRTRALPVHHQHPTALPLLILNYPSTLKLDKINSRDSDHYILLAKPIFPKKRGMIDPSPKAILFSKKSGLLEKIEYVEHSVEFQDYHELGTLMIPRKVIYDFFGRDSIVTGKFNSKITEIVSNYTMDKGLFELPEIRKKPGK